MSTAAIVRPCTDLGRACLSSARKCQGVWPHGLAAYHVALVQASHTIPPRRGCDGAVPRRAAGELLANGAESSSATKPLTSAAECLKVSSAPAGSPTAAGSARKPFIRLKTCRAPDSLQPIVRSGATSAKKRLLSLAKYLARGLTIATPIRSK